MARHDDEAPLPDRMINRALSEERRNAEQRNDMLRSLMDAEAMLRTASTRLRGVHDLLARDLHEAANYARAAIGRAKS